VFIPLQSVATLGFQPGVEKSLMAVQVGDGPSWLQSPARCQGENHNL
jgi:hypothetical protein